MSEKGKTLIAVDGEFYDLDVIAKAADLVQDYSGADGSCESWDCAHEKCLVLRSAPAIIRYIRTLEARLDASEGG